MAGRILRAFDKACPHGPPHPADLVAAVAFDWPKGHTQSSASRSSDLEHYQSHTIVI